METHRVLEGWMKWAPNIRRRKNVSEMRAAGVKNRIWDTPQIKAQVEEDFEGDLEVMREVPIEEPAENSATEAWCGKQEITDSNSGRNNSQKS